jgi:hypothetical protein
MRAINHKYLILFIFLMRRHEVARFATVVSAARFKGE